MADPPEMTLRTLNGRFTINKTFSDSVDKMMALQGFPYLIRMAARTASIELSFTSLPNSNPDTASDSQSPSQHPPPASVPSKIKIATLMTAVGMSLGKEKVDERNIDGVPWEENDGALGPIIGRAWWCKLDELSLDYEGGEKRESHEGLEFLRGFDGQGQGESKWRLRDGGIREEVGGDEVIRLQIQAKKSGAWADHVWGFEEGFGEGEEKGKRRYTRRMLARKGEKFEMAKLVYDYLGPN